MNNTRITVGLLGAALDTGNLGVNALAVSSVKVVRKCFPDSKIFLVGSSKIKKKYKVPVGEQYVEVESLPIRISPRPFVKSHWLTLYLLIHLKKMFKFQGVKKILERVSPAYKDLSSIDIFLDITGGDSFSDIYGLSRFLLAFTIKKIVLLMDKPFVMLPQTYGPFKRTITRKLAHNILIKSAAIYSRDKAGIIDVSVILKGNNREVKVAFCPDVAFVLDPVEIQNICLDKILEAKDQGYTVIGLNVSGLLYSGGYSRDNMFGLSFHYPELVDRLIEKIFSIPKTKIVLVPHVISYNDEDIESDFGASLKIIEKYGNEDGRLLLCKEKNLDQSQTKYIISKCDFFMGSRMHATIAALSQGIPAVGLAYSNKFIGVFESVGVGELVLDLRKMDIENVLAGIEELYSKSNIFRDKLIISVPRVQDQILTIPLNDYLEKASEKR